MYSAESGRFCSRDPIGYWGGLALYHYANTNPPTLGDFDGFLARSFNDDIRTRCDNIRAAAGDAPDQPEISDNDKASCRTYVRELLLERDGPAKEIWENRPSDCPLRFECKNCNSLASYSAGVISICWNKCENRDAQGNIGNDAMIHHELIHYLQDCEGRNQGSGCLQSLKREAEAYFCANSIGVVSEGMDSVTEAVLQRALNSSCIAHCGVGEPRDQTLRLFRLWFYDWWSQNGRNREQMCSNPHTHQPPIQ